MISFANAFEPVAILTFGSARPVGRTLSDSFRIPRSMTRGEVPLRGANAMHTFSGVFGNHGNRAVETRSLPLSEPGLASAQRGGSGSVHRGSDFRRQGGCPDVDPTN